MGNSEYVKGSWTDSRGGVYPVSFKKSWGEHEFTEEEQRILLSGKEISFSYKGRMMTGHLQYCVYNGREYFGFSHKYQDGYEEYPVYRGSHRVSTFEADLRRENDVMAEFMKRNFYDGLQNADGSRVSDFQRITDVDVQKSGVDVIFTQNGRTYLIDEKAQMDYIYKNNPLPTFALELLNGTSGAVGWFVNDGLKTEYYMFLWPHADRKPLSVDNITYVYYALVNKKKLRQEVERRYQKDGERLLEYARRMLEEKMGDMVFDKAGKCIGYRYKEDGFDDECYLYYTLSKQEKPVNLVVRRSRLEQISEDYGVIRNRN